MKSVLLIIQLLLVTFNVFAEGNKKVFAFNNILFVNTPDKGVLPRLNAKNYLYDKNRNWMDNDQMFYPVVADLATQMSLNDAVDFEMQSAMAMGIDGFSFIYTTTKEKRLYDRFDQIIEAYFNVAKEKNYPFYFNLCIKFEPNIPIDEAIADASNILKKYSNVKFANSKHWHVEDGKKMIVLTKVKSLITKEEKKQLINVADKDLDMSILFDRIDQISAVTQGDYNFIYTSIWPGRKEEILQASNKFYSARMEAFYMRNDKLVKQYSNRLKSVNAPFVHTIFHDHVSSYYVDRATKKRIPRSFAEKKQMGPDEFYREHDDLGLTKGIRLGFEQAKKYKSSLVFLNSWNMFIEGSQFRQDFNHGFGLSPMTNTLIKLWKNEEIDPVIFVAFKNRMTEDKSLLEYKVRLKVGSPQYSKDSIEIVTYSNVPAKLVINGTPVRDLVEGLNVKTIPWQEGNIDVSLKKGSKEIASFNSLREVRSLKVRNQSSTIYLSSEDNNYLEGIIDILAVQEVNYFDKRFLLEQKKKEMWILLEKERMRNHITNITLNETNGARFDQIKKKENIEYEKEVKKLLSEFHFEVWQDLKAEKLLEIDATLSKFNIFDLNNSYNILDFK
ncbi:hypothetical protein [Flammeovirga sp. SubArs3]|uniref:hypothetical protein n=1 Tax=Flammeovirga sp. SubArs3 TaxID=2995316 RepID=UPI00248C5DCB|nr:hypothetical protein [Flammeovirga sp. SubArs3]